MSKNLKTEQKSLLPYYWLNGAIKNHESDGIPTVGTFSQAMDYSIVLIEGMRVNMANQKKMYGFRLKDHLKRMLKGWKHMGFDTPYTLEKIFQGLEACIIKNIEYLKTKKSLQNFYIRPKIYNSDPVIKPYAGSAKCNIVIECFPLDQYLDKSGVTITLADYIRTERYSSYYTKGAGKYAEYGALRNSASPYEDVLQLGLGKGGKLIFTEGTTSNIFFVKKGELLTPGCEDFILEGITRDSVIQMARFLKIPVREGEVSLSTILECEEIFLTGTASFLAPIKRLGRYELEKGPITEKLFQLFAEVRSGKVAEFMDWLTPFET